MTIPVIAIVGASNSGKTRVATALITLLTAQGYRVAAVKHCPHGHQVDRPGSDSARLFAAGASQVFLTSPGRTTTIARAEGDQPLEQTLSSLQARCDLVIAEGFKESMAPKVLVLGGEQLSAPVQDLVAVVGGQRRADGVPCYGFDDLEGLARQIQAQLLKADPEAPALP